MPWGEKGRGSKRWSKLDLQGPVSIRLCVFQVMGYFFLLLLLSFPEGSGETLKCRGIR